MTYNCTIGFISAVQTALPKTSDHTAEADFKLSALIARNHPKVLFNFIKL
jgi:hypothetical protein